MEYLLSFFNPLSHFINVKLTINCNGKEDLCLAIPTWRPGRYEAANFAKNLRGLQIRDEEGNHLSFSKIDHSTWKLHKNFLGKIIVSYDYHAYKMDAGNSWFDESLIYVNFINCLMYVVGRQKENCKVTLLLPDNYRVSCGLTSVDHTFFAKDYFELVDSPLIASRNLEHFTYSVFEKEFHIWINGKHNLNMNKLLEDFQLFSEYQVKLMGSFPEETYHFQIILLPYKFYHGVEHHDSTVICLGPGESLNDNDLYGQLLGVSSHELFHAWNIIKIRPKELLPYQFNKDVFFPTGYVAEGFTTYYGDLLLLKSKVYDKEWFFNELNNLFKRHFLNDGRLNYSVIDSSLDLWLDGYTPGIPHRKSSIYVEGAIIALMLDLLIRRNTDNAHSLDDVMRILWKEFGQNEIGYSHQDIEKACEVIYGGSLKEFFKDYVEGTKPNEHLLNDLLHDVGCRLLETEPETWLEKFYGVKAIMQNGVYYVTQTALNSIGEKYFAVEDEIISINSNEPFSESVFCTAPSYFQIKRNHQEISFSLNPGEITYYKCYKIIELENITPKQAESLNNWLGL